VKTTFIAVGLTLFSLGITSQAYASPVSLRSELSTGSSLQPSGNLRALPSDQSCERLTDKSASFVFSTSFSKGEVSAAFLNTGAGPLPNSVPPNVPEPGTILLLTTGLLGVIGRARTKSLAKKR